MSILRFTISGTSPISSAVENVFTYDSDEEVDEFNAGLVLQDFVSHLIANILTDILDYISEEFAFTSVRLEKCTDVPNKTWVGLGEEFFSLAGTAAIGQPLPATLAIRSQANIVGTGRKGSKFIGALMETDWTGSAWGAGLIAAMGVFSVGWAGSFVGTLTGIFFTPGVFRTVETIGQGFVPFGGTVTVDSTPSHQDRREIGLGI